MPKLEKIKFISSQGSTEHKVGLYWPSGLWPRKFVDPCLQRAACFFIESDYQAADIDATESLKLKLSTKAGIFTISCMSRDSYCTKFYKILRYHKISKIGQFHLCSDIRKPRKIYWSDKVLPAGSWAWFGKSDGQTLTSLDPRRPRLWSSPTFVPGKSISTKFNTINRLTRIEEQRKQFSPY